MSYNGSEKLTQRVAENIFGKYKNRLEPSDFPFLSWSSAFNTTVEGSTSLYLIILHCTVALLGSTCMTLLHSTKALNHYTTLYYICMALLDSTCMTLLHSAMVQRTWRYLSIPDSSILYQGSAWVYYTLPWLYFSIPNSTSLHHGSSCMALLDSTIRSEIEHFLGGGMPPHCPSGRASHALLRSAKYSDLW